MKAIKTATKNFTKKMAINIGMGTPLKDAADTVLESIQAAAIVEDVDRETGEIKVAAAIVDGNGAVYTSISATVLESIPDIIELIDDGEEFDVRVIVRTSKAGREFLTLNVL